MWHFIVFREFWSLVLELPFVFALPLALWRSPNLWKSLNDRSAFNSSENGGPPNDFSDYELRMWVLAKTENAYSISNSHRRQLGLCSVSLALHDILYVLDIVLILATVYRIHVIFWKLDRNSTENKSKSNQAFEELNYVNSSHKVMHKHALRCFVDIPLLILTLCSGITVWRLHYSYGEIRFVKINLS